ncbi:FAD-binding oxidoreductase [Halomonas sp. DQ26W]|nr:FAD-binding oxidoreductase [Halomonas sp. DQ26W]
MEQGKCGQEATWAGLRPAAADGIPFIRAVPGIHGLHVNAGHSQWTYAAPPGSP